MIYSTTETIPGREIRESVGVVTGNNTYTLSNFSSRNCFRS